MVLLRHRHDALAMPNREVADEVLCIDGEHLTVAMKVSPRLSLHETGAVIAATKHTALVPRTNRHHVTAIGPNVPPSAKAAPTAGWKVDDRPPEDCALGLRITQRVAAVRPATDEAGSFTAPREAGDLPIITREGEVADVRRAARVADALAQAALAR
jgi:hypothetical protein